MGASRQLRVEAIFSKLNCWFHFGEKPPESMFSLLVQTRQWRQSLNAFTSAENMETRQKFENMCNVASGEHIHHAHESCCEVWLNDVIGKSCKRADNCEHAQKKAHASLHVVLPDLTQRILPVFRMFVCSLLLCMIAHIRAHIRARVCACFSHNGVYVCMCACSPHAPRSTLHSMCRLQQKSPKTSASPCKPYALKFRQKSQCNVAFLAFRNLARSRFARS